MSERTKGYLQLILVVVFILFALGVNALLQSSKTKLNIKKEKRDLYVNVIDVTAQNKKMELNLTGIFKAKSEVEIVPQVSGRVVEVNNEFFKGGVFEKDQLLFVIEDEDYVLEVRRLEAEVKKAETEYELERAESRAALAEWYQMHPNRSDAPDLVLRKPQLRQALATLRAAESSLQNARLDLERTEFRFPFAGRVLESLVYDGQYLSAGQSYGRVYDITSMEIESAISDKAAAILAESGEDVEVKIATNYLGKKYEYDGVLKRTFGEYEENTRFGRIVFGLKDQFNNELFPGIFAKIKVVGKEVKDVFILPIAALQNGNKIWQVEGDILKELKAEILYFDDEEVVVKTDLESAKIVVGKISGGFEGTKVKIGGDFGTGSGDPLSAEYGFESGGGGEK